MVVLTLPAHSPVREIGFFFKQRKRTWCRRWLKEISF
jgi:hypothetical protein